MTVREAELYSSRRVATKTSIATYSSDEGRPQASRTARTLVARRTGCAAGWAVRRRIAIVVIVSSSTSRARRPGLDVPGFAWDPGTACPESRPDGIAGPPRARSGARCGGLCREKRGRRVGRLSILRRVSLARA